MTPPEDSIGAVSPKPGCERAAIKRDARVESGGRWTQAVAILNIRKEPRETNEKCKVRREVLIENQIKIARRQKHSPGGAGHSILRRSSRGVLNIVQLSSRNA